MGGSKDRFMKISGIEFWPFWKIAGLPVFLERGCQIRLRGCMFLRIPQWAIPKVYPTSGVSIMHIFYEFTGLPVSWLQGCQIQIIFKGFWKVLRDVSWKFWENLTFFKNGGVASFLEQGCQFQLRGCQFFPIPSRVQWAIPGVNLTNGLRVMQVFINLRCCQFFWWQGCQIPKKFEGIFGRLQGMFSENFGKIGHF